MGTSCKVVTAQPRPYIKIHLSGKKRASKDTVDRVLRATSVAQRNDITSSKAGTVTSRAKSTSCKAATTIRPHGEEGDFDVEQYEKVHIELESLLPKVHCQENESINAVVKILTTKFITLPLPNTYTLYHSGVCKSILALSRVPTSCVQGVCYNAFHEPGLTPSNSGEYRWHCP